MSNSDIEFTARLPQFPSTHMAPCSEHSNNCYNTVTQVKLLQSHQAHVHHLVPSYTTHHFQQTSHHVHVVMHGGHLTHVHVPVMSCHVMHHVHIIMDMSCATDIPSCTWHA
jgi:hypothetical protein